MRGYTLIEIMIVIAMIAIVATLALPLYTAYTQTSREGALLISIETMVLFQEDLRLRTGAYGEGVWDLPNGVSTLLTATGWEPRNQEGTVYEAELIVNGYKVTATDTSGTVVCMQYPDKARCVSP